MYKKYYKFIILQAALIHRFDYLNNIKFEKVLKI